MHLYLFLFGFAVFDVTLSANTLVDVLLSQHLTTMVRLLDKSNVLETIESGGPYTVLAPDNGAWVGFGKPFLDQVEQDPIKLKSMMEYLIIKGEQFSRDLTNSTRLMTLNGLTVHVTVSSTGQKLQFNHAVAYLQDIQASDGVIYILDSVLPVPLGTIAEILALPQWSLSTFFNDVIEAGYGPLLNDSQSLDYTVFAPNNAAFQKLSSSQLTFLSSTKRHVIDMVQYHIHPGSLPYNPILLHGGTFSTLLNDNDITISRFNHADPNRLRMTLVKHLPATNGMVWVVSDVVLPKKLPFIG